MARNDDWLGWVVRSGPEGECHVIVAASRKGSDPHDYFVAARSRREAIELLRRHGLHGFRFREENNIGVDEAAIEVCLARFGTVLRRRINDRHAPMEVASPH